MLKKVDILRNFTQGERIQLIKTTVNGMRASYFKSMIKERNGIVKQSRKLKETDTDLLKRIKQQYVDMGVISSIDSPIDETTDIWKLLRKYSDRVPIPDEYTSPWRSKVEAKAHVKRTLKQATRKQHYENWIKELNAKINNPNTPEYRRIQLKKQRDNLERELKHYGR